MRRALLIILPLMLLVGGCAKPNPFVGKWQREFDPASKTGDKKVDAEMEASAKGTLIEFKTDNTAILSNGANWTNASYTVAEKVATVTLPDVKGEPKAPPMTARLSDDGRKLTTSGPVDFTFTKISN